MYSLQTLTIKEFSKHKQIPIYIRTPPGGNDTAGPVAAVTMTADTPIG